MKNLLVIGAGDAGWRVIREIRNHPELGCQIIGLIDDDPKKLNTEVMGVRVSGGRERIIEIGKKEKVDEIIIAIPSADGKTVREIINRCKETGASFKIVPGILEILAGDVQLHQIREVNPEDLLGRETVTINIDEIANLLKGKRVLITGAAGSIGSELSKYVAKFSPERLILADHNENDLYLLYLSLKESAQTIPIIADIRDARRLEAIFKTSLPEIIFHSAALKHVPLMEENPIEAIKTNIFGTQSLIELGERFSAERFIFISTDKSSAPISVMGASKRVAESLFQLYTPSKQRFSVVRFGNILGSSGSVIPIFKSQIKRRVALTITDVKASRYFMTSSEAVSLILQAASLEAPSGRMYLLDMGEPVNITDLAKNLLVLSSKEDIGIEYIGLRAGEKLKEEDIREGTKPTAYPKIFYKDQNPVKNPKKLIRKLHILKSIIEREDEERAREFLFEIVKFVDDFVDDFEEGS
ncbi:polysaccharide biosynthesis protein [bacterium]|nr:polysaccharide biosynthesis protein [bacterium]MBU1599821.1 polysaccharide biosynthesis protein [bacterium]MBU2462244.1 polysaccharide biosynthesis protein [bacterium]